MVSGAGFLGTTLGPTYTSTITLSNNAALAFNSSTNQTLTGNITGAGSVMQSGNSLLDLTGVNTYTSGTVNGGTLELDYSGRTSNPSAPSHAVGALGTLVLYNTATGIDNFFPQNSAISGAGTVVKAGPGYFDLWQGSTLTNFTGTFNVQSGTMAINNLGAGAGMPQATLNIASGATFDVRYNSSLAVDTLTGSGTITHSFTDPTETISVGNNNGSSTWAGTIINGPNNGLALTKNGTGIFTMTAANSYTGSTTIGGGTLQLGVGQSGLDGSFASTTVSDSGTLLYNIAGTHAAGYKITGPGGIASIGPGLVVLSASSSYSGGTYVSGGTLQANNASALGSGALTVNSGVLNLNGNSVTVGGISGAGGSVISSSAATLALAPAVAKTYSGVIAGGIAVTLNSSSAVQTFAGPNTYSGLTTISAGTLALGPAGGLGNGNLTIASGGVFDVSAYGGPGYSAREGGVLTAGRTASPATDVNGTLNVQNAALNVASSSSIGTLTVNGGFGLSGGTWNYAANGSWLT